MKGTVMPDNNIPGQERNAVGRRSAHPELVDEMLRKIHDVVFRQRRFKEKDFSISQLAKELNASVHTVSLLINRHLGMSFTSYVNQFRVKEAKKMLASRRYHGLNMEDIGAMAGFSTRQSFYVAFAKAGGLTPRQYRMEHLKLHPVADGQRKPAGKRMKRNRK